jgi:hypothetical protein
MLRALVLSLALFGVLGSLAMPRFATAAALPSLVVVQSLALFDSESAAQAHCPHDAVVWLNTRSGIYHYKGERWYGNTKHGAYVCEKEAIAAGDRATENGQ